MSEKEIGVTHPHAILLVSMTAALIMGCSHIEPPITNSLSSMGASGKIFYRGKLTETFGSSRIRVDQYEENLSQYVNGGRHCINVLLDPNELSEVQKSLKESSKYVIEVKIFGHFLNYAYVANDDPIASQSRVYDNDCQNDDFLVVEKLVILK